MSQTTQITHIGYEDLITGCSAAVSRLDRQLVRDAPGARSPRFRAGILVPCAGARRNFIVFAAESKKCSARRECEGG